jgi:peptidoglycan/LPS O-acetylase OafA/YrhL
VISDSSVNFFASRTCNSDCSNISVTTLQRKRQQHLPQLDGLRGLAIAIVVLGHMVVFPVGFGLTRLGPLPPLGVNLFFVLSGYLITRILLDTRNKTNYYLSFYARRALRIWPLYFLVLGILFFVTNHRVAALTFDDTRLRWPFFVLYVQNLVYKQAAMLGPVALGVTWSLAVEEQFYTLWPTIVRSLSNVTLKRLLVMVIAIAPVARFFCPQFGFDPYINPLCRFDAMAMGGLVAIWMTEREPSREKISRVAWSIVPIALLFAALGYATGIFHLISKTVESALWTTLLLGALSSALVIRAMSHSLLRFLGKISYCAYLVHFIIASFTVSLWPGAGLGHRILRIAVVLSMTSLIGILSWKFLEEPILRFKQYFPAGKSLGSDEPHVSPAVALGSSEETRGAA